MTRPSALKRISILTFLVLMQGYAALHAQTNDCEGAEVICDDGMISFTPMGPGGPDLGPGTFTTCGTSEHQSQWYYFEFNSLTPPGSIIEFTITPFVPFDDYDFAVWGPGTSGDPLECDNMGASIRCDFALPSGDGGTGLVVGGGGSGFQEALTVNPGDGFYLLVDNFDNTTTGFDLTWGGSAAPFLDCDATPPCDIITNAGADTTICNSETVQLNGSATGTMGSETYEWTAVPVGAIGFLSDPNILNPLLDGGNSSGTFVFTLTISEGTCVSEDDVSVTLLLDVTPVFNDHEICETDNPVTLPTTSVNGIAGTWDPPVIDPAGLGGTSVTAEFTPDAGQMVCTTPTEFMIPIEAAVDPVFDFPTEMCPSDPPFSFPNTSINGITGTWVPSSINPSSIPGGSLTTTFTPNADQCGTTLEVTVNVSTGTEPVFDPIGPLCALDAPITLPVTDLNGITGSWDMPVIDPAPLGGQTITVGFTPDPGQGDCTTATTMDITIDAVVQPVFDPLELCDLDAPVTLPATSTNGITGTWDTPVVDPAGQGGNTITAQFTPDPGQGCVDIGQLMINVSLSIVPAFNIAAEICDSDGPLTLPATSTNGIPGSWSPATIDPAGQGGTTVTAEFTPAGDECAEVVSVDVDILESVTPQFDQIGPLCELEAPIALPTNSLNGISGTWDIPVIDPAGQGGATVNVTFTPDGGQGPCILQQSMSIQIESSQEPLFDPIGPLCELDDLIVLPTTSLDGIPGTWDVPVIDPAGQGGSTINTTFTPDPAPDECYDQVIISVVISEPEVPQFNVPTTLCASDDLLVLPGMSTNGVSGTWAPSVIDPAGNGGTTIEAFFTPDAGVCAAEISIVFTIEEGVTPEFDQIGLLCEFDDVVTLPTTSLNGVDGTWSIPQINPADYAGTVVNVTFTPTTGGGCIGIAQMMIEVASGEVPVFDQVGPVCEADGPVTLPVVSLNGIEGEWSVAVIDPAGNGGSTITTTFTPAAGLCAATESMDIQILDLPDIVNIDVQNPADCNNADGSITITADGTSLEYSIDGGVTWQPQNVFEDLGGGVFDVVVRPQGSLFCYANETVVLSTAESPVLDEIVAIDPSDCSGSDGSLEIIAQGDDLEYSIDGGTTWQASNVFSGLTAGSYAIAIRPQNSTGCQTTANAQLQDPPVPQITNVLVEDVTDCGLEDGEIVAISNADAIEFSIDMGATWQASNTFSGLAPGDYTVIVRHAGSTQCADTAVATIAAPQAPQIDSIDIMALTDCGVSDGQITIFATGGGLEYSIDGGATWQPANIFAGLGSGQYTVMVRRATAIACADEMTAEITAPGAPEISSITTTNPSDCAAADGSIVVIASGNALEYSIDGGSTWQGSNTFNNLMAASYTVIVRPADAPSCTAQSSATLVSPSAPVIQDILAIDPSDCSRSDGSLEIIAQGDDLEYSIDGGTTWQASNVFTGMSAGSYAIAIRPQNSTGCQTTANAQLQDPPVPQITNILVDDVTDCGLEDGEIVAISNADAIEFSIDGGATWQPSNTFSGLAPGDYTVIVRHAGSTQCADTAVATIAAPQAPQIDSVDVVVLTDCGVSDGQITIFATGGGLEYSIDGGATWQPANIFAGLGSGQYTVMVRRATAIACADEMTAEITAPGAPAITSITTTDPSDCAASDGSISVNANGADLEYSLDGGTTWQSDNTFTGLVASSYTVVVRPANAPSCTAQSSATLTSPAAPVIADILTTDPSDCGVADGSIVVEASGDTLEYALNGIKDWQTENVFTGLGGGNYTVAVRPIGAEECAAMRNATLVAPTVPQAELAVESATDCGAEDGQITILSTDTGLEYALNASPWQTTSVFSDLAPGEYDVRIRRVGAPGCALTLAGTVEGMQQPGITDLVVTELSDCDRSDGAAEIVATGNGELEFALRREGPWQPANVFSGLSAGNYTVYVRIANATGCVDSTSFTLENPNCNCSGIEVTAVADSVSCPGSSDGAAEIIDIVGTDDYAVVWDTGEEGLVVGDLPEGWAAYMITYNTACTLRDSIFIGAPEVLDYVVELTDADCPGVANGRIDVQFVSGGTGTIAYALNGGPYQSSPAFEGLSAGMYNLTVRDANLCTQQVEVEITDGGPVEIDLAEVVVIQAGETVELIPVVDPIAIDSFAWSPVVGIEDPLALNARVSPMETTAYTFTAFRGACSEQRTVIVIVEVDVQVYIPNVFSPNGDGVNDAFTVLGDPSSIQVVDRFTIFDRWGDVLFDARDFQLNDAQGMWDGTARGNVLNPGVFVYRMQATLVTGEEIHRRGSVTLVQ